MDIHPGSYGAAGLTHPSEMLPLGIGRRDVHAEADQRHLRVVQPRRVVVDAPDVPERQLDGLLVDRHLDRLRHAAAVALAPGVVAPRHARDQAGLAAAEVAHHHHLLPDEGPREVRHVHQRRPRQRLALQEGLRVHGRHGALFADLA